MRKLNLRRILLALLLVVIVGLTGFVAWAGTPSGVVMAEARAALLSDSLVRVESDKWLAFQPADGQATAGYIFYPGGRVQAEAYAPMARAVAEAGYLAVIVQVPLNLAFFDTDAAADVIAAYPDIQHWAVGGHSLGGVAASSFAFAQPDTVEGLVILASYPAPWEDLSRRDDLAVASIYGENDGLAAANVVEESAIRLPQDATFVMIEGGNHGQFGWYGEQAGDKPATISREEQQAQTVAATIAILEAISGE